MAMAPAGRLIGWHVQLLRIQRAPKASSERRFLKKRRSHDVWPGSPELPEIKPGRGRAVETTLSRRSDDGRLRAWRHLQRRWSPMTVAIAIEGTGPPSPGMCRRVEKAR